VAAKMNFRRLRAALVCAVAVAARPAGAQTSPVVDTGPQALPRPRWSPSNPVAPGVWPTTVPWRTTFFYFENSVSTQTVGVGTSYQSRDPYYELTLGLRPRLYLAETELYEISLRADLGVTSERTNSDTTSEQGEWSATDFELAAAFAYELRKSAAETTAIDIRLPRVTLPTSKVSYDSGKILGLGVRALLAEDVQLAGPDSAFFPNFEIGLRAEYGYQFTRSQVPTNPGLERLRLDPDGHSVISDQLGGASFASQSALFGALAVLYVHQNVMWSTLMDVRPAWHYPVRHDVEVCGVVLTGCTTPEGTNNPQTRSAITSFSTDVLITLNDVLGLSFGYLNLTDQLGPDGRRRSVFYSPDAHFYAQLNVGLDQLYVGVAQHRSPANRASGDLHRF
jgi:hypothetical protein